MHNTSTDANSKDDVVDDELALGATIRAIYLERPFQGLWVLDKRGDIGGEPDVELERFGVVL